MAETKCFRHLLLKPMYKMTKSVKILSAALGVMMLLPGLAKFTEPFKTFIYQHLTIIGFPFPEVMQYVVKFSEIGVGLSLIFITFYGKELSKTLLNKIFYANNLAVFSMMVVAIYTHLHPGVPAEILPVEFKPPVMPVVYILLVLLNVYFYRFTSSKK